MTLQHENADNLQYAHALWTYIRQRTAPTFFLSLVLKMAAGVSKMEKAQ